MSTYGLNPQQTLSIPRYLGLKTLTRRADGQMDLVLGYSPALQRELTVDEATLNLLTAFLDPTSIEKAAASCGIALEDAQQAAEALFEARILRDVNAVDDDLVRYDRHMLFYGMAGADGLAVQQRIRKAKVALWGMGGIGNWVSSGLIGAGFGELILVDFDTVELSNLTRQIHFTEQDIGKLKTEVAAERLAKMNTQTKITTITKKISDADAMGEILKRVDVLVISADTPAEIHNWADNACKANGIAYINAGYRDGVGIVGPLTKHGVTSCYMCHKPLPGGTPAKPVDEQIAATRAKFNQRYQAASFGPLNALVSSVAVAEVIKYIGGFGACASLDHELQIDPLSMTIGTKRYARDPHCWQCGC